MCFLALLATLNVVLITPAATLSVRFDELVTKIPPKELSLRYKLFTKAEAFVNNLNHMGLTYRSEVNKFALMTPSELELYHGINSSATISANHITIFGSTDSVVSIPRSVSWIEKKHVTSIKNQDGCGACWTFGPVVAIEGMYKKVTGKLKEFSNQELLDCVYDHITYNGCHGGRETKAFDFVTGRGRLALWRDYPYVPRDQKCRSYGKPNGLKAAKLESYTLNDGTEASTIRRLSEGPLSVAFHAVLSIHYYKDGIYKDEKCGTTANHAVAAVAYTPSYILIKNSWGDDWGMSGLFKFSRNDAACGIHLPENNFFVNIIPTGNADHDKEDKPLEFVDDDPNPLPTDTPLTTQSNCVDKSEGCLEIYCGWYDNYKYNCRKTCNYC